jgi:1-deoxy-D-xylulose-5-phosphate synthase
MGLLEKIKSPADLRKIDVKKLPDLAQEIRERIISVISESGGHLAPGLGVVELTIALHYIYNAPRDKIVWDVSHQTYSHKILTGRNDRFATIRQHNGLSGFATPDESEYDSFGTGHASTSISAALGIALARDKTKKNFAVVAVIGDGSLTGGLAFEGLNNVGITNTKMTVVLNDNNMSISPNVGAISRYLNKIITDPRYNRLKDEIWNLTKRLTSNKRFEYLGESFRQIAGRVDESVKNLLLPGKFFENLGFRYFGPVDGHNIKALIEMFRSVKELRGPKIVHVITTKGKGFEPAEEDKEFFHGLSSFEPSTGSPRVKPGAKKIPTYSEIFSKTLCKLAAQNKKIIGITAAMAPGTGMKAFAEKYPDRFYDVGIAEAHAVTFAAGLALSGFYPVVAIYSTFLQRAYDQLIHDAALQRLPMLICMDRAGLAADDGPTHHGAFDISYCRLIPNTVIMAPKDEDEMQHMMYTATTYGEGPVFIRYPRGQGLGVKFSRSFEAIPIGRARILKQGSDLAIIGYGEMVPSSLECAEMLMSRGLNPTIINGRFAKPVDLGLIREILKTHRYIVTMEANALKGGFGSAILEAVSDENSKHIPLLRLGYPDRFITHGSKPLLYREMGLDPESMANKILDFVKPILPSSK